MDISEVRDTNPDDYHGVIVGASIHMGKHDKHVVEFVRKNREMLERLPSAFFSVSLAAHGDTEEAEGYVEPLGDGLASGQDRSFWWCTSLDPLRGSSNAT